MLPHPDFADTKLPRAAVLGEFRLTPLSGADVAEDFAAIKTSEPVLQGLFWGMDWPRSVTLASNLTDLHWHDCEFEAKRSFSWIIRDENGVYEGCAYLFPELGARGRGEVVTWFCDTPDRLRKLKTFNAAFQDWLLPYLPEGYALRSIGNDDTMGKTG